MMMSTLVSVFSEKVSERTLPLQPGHRPPKSASLQRAENPHAEEHKALCDLGAPPPAQFRISTFPRSHPPAPRGLARVTRHLCFLSTPGKGVAEKTPPGGVFTT